MQEHKITKEDGTDIKWTIAKNKNSFCLLYNDSKQKFKFTPTENLNCELFMIGGGGAGGYFFGGGGGAGASYINNNYTFKKNKTYTFEIGTGGMCDIADINKLFKSGLTLNIYNNTNIKLLNLNFTNDDYSSLGIQNSGMMQSFNVNNITIPASIFHNNTTYIWEGYIKTNSTGYFNVTINTKINTIIWVDKFVFNNDNALIEGNNINDVKIIQLETNKFYNIKIIAHNDTNNSNNFNVSFEGCQLFNFDKNEEKYNYIPATDTILTYRNDDNTFETLRCKGGGNGGCGFFNKNTTLDGGCGGGSGINKIKGTSIITPIYNGYDGAIGDYCGGGGGIMSAGKNNIGGDGKIINWFNETLIFGAGGNAANLSETRNLGYGCGGNGGECCYYSKLLINNNGNNGCILIYVKSSPLSTAPPIIEGFTDKAKNMLPDDSISKKLIENSFKISKYINMAVNTANRHLFFTQGFDNMAYINLVQNITSDNVIIGGSNYKKYDTLNNQTFIYDMLVISKLYAIVYRLYWYHFNYTLNKNTTDWDAFCIAANLKIYDEYTAGIKTKIENNTISIANLFNIANLQLNNNIDSSPGKINYATYNNNLYTLTAAADNGSPAMDKNVIIKYYNNEEDNAIVPVYHEIKTGKKLNYLNTFMTEEISKKAYYKITLGAVDAVTLAVSGITTVTAPTGFTHATSIWGTEGSTTINILNADSVIIRANLNSAYTKFVSYIQDSGTYSDNYLYNRIAIYLEAFNTILNTDSTIMLTTLKYYMHYYNLVVYNISIQYGLTKMHNERITLTPTSSSGCYTTLNGLDIASGAVAPGCTSATNSPDRYTIALSSTETSTANTINADLIILKDNLDSIIKNIDKETQGNTLTDKINTASTKNEDTSKIFYDNQQDLNKIINEYNGELENFNNISFYYKLVVAFAILLTIIILFIFGAKSIDNNSKISVYVIIITMIIIAFILYKQFAGVNEGFTIIINKAAISSNYGIIGTLISPDSVNNYKIFVEKYINKLLLSLSRSNIKDNLDTSLTYINKLSVIKNEKAEIYKIKKISLMNSIEILKKNANFYYYMIIAIFVSIIILNIGLILYLLNPAMIMQIVILCAIPFIILIYIVSYYIHKSTRLAENKNYWSNFNPSSSTLEILNVS